jgi:hypothetical protein
MDYTSLFYWLTVADNAKAFFNTFIIIFTIISGISTLWFLIDRDVDDWSENDATINAKKWMWWSYPFMILFWSLFIFTPSKRDALLIVAGGQTMNFLSSDSTAKQIPHDVLNFVSVELQNMAKEAKMELGIYSQKERILQEAKTLSTEQLMERMKSDTTYAKIILGN